MRSAQVGYVTVGGVERSVGGWTQYEADVRALRYAAGESPRQFYGGKETITAGDVVESFERRTRVAGIRSALAEERRARLRRAEAEHVGRVKMGGAVTIVEDAPCGCSAGDGSSSGDSGSSSGSSSDSGGSDEDIPHICSGDDPVAVGRLEAAVLPHLIREEKRLLRGDN